MGRQGRIGGALIAAVRNLIALAEDGRADAVWFYPEPYESVADIAGYVAFYTDQVDVAVGT
ncbi:DUF427 domain-containing protein [Streptomyces sp. NPDC051572]|uniref:DUF427 domain-containing protein n=1 Tax=Streptomyces sp. NPDC051572 TaxID=3155802 RepID=UPI00344F6EAC